VKRTIELTTDEVRDVAFPKRVRDKLKEFAAKDDKSEE
jgi:hypothetical protein